MGDKYRNYKLSSGDEVIGKVVGVNTRYVTINRPMAVKTVTLEDPYTGEQKNVTLMRPWVTISETLDHKIPLKHIILESSPTPDIIGAYLNKLEREDVIDDLVKEMMGDPEQLEEYLKNIIESEFDSSPLPELEDKEPRQEQEMDERVQMNFQIPPGLFLAFLMNGIISFNEDAEGEFDIDEFMKMKNEGFKRNSRRPKKNNDIEDYFRDWNPEP
tara:strand:+ start:2237 stop:2881 length:645 start_codon:yes stop_codon:yes gene_type:complete